MIAALVTAEKQELADAVSSGKLTQAQADTITSSLQQRFTDLVNGTLPKGGPGLGFHIGSLDSAATYLGLTQAELRTQLESGKTLAQIANATPTKSAQGLVDALAAPSKARLDAAVAGNTLTATQEATALTRLNARFTALVNASLARLLNHD